MDREYLISLLKLAQAGDKIAEDNLLTHAKNYEMMKRIHKFLHKNRQVEDDDLKQEFMIGVALSIYKADLTIGDPIEYIMSQGVFRVRAYLRKNIMTSVNQVCMDCGYESRLNRIGGRYVCKKCGSVHIETHEICDHNELLLENMTIEDEYDRLSDDIGSRQIIEEFRQTLDKNTNIYKLFELLYDHDINRDNPEITNYIKEIAKRWGTSQNLVVQVKDKLACKLTRFCFEKGYLIIDNKFIDRRTHK